MICRPVNYILNRAKKLHASQRYCHQAKLSNTTQRSFADLCRGPQLYNEDTMKLASCLLRAFISTSVEVGNYWNLHVGHNLRKGSIEESKCYIHKFYVIFVSDKSIVLFDMLEIRHLNIYFSYREFTLSVQFGYVLQCYTSQF